MERRKSAEKLIMEISKENTIRYLEGQSEEINMIDCAVKNVLHNWGRLSGKSLIEKQGLIRKWFRSFIPCIKKSIITESTCTQCKKRFYCYTNWGNIEEMRHYIIDSIDRITKEK